MAQIGMPLNGAVYNAEDAGIWFYGRTNGVFADNNCLKVVHESGMDITVMPGGAWLTPNRFRGISFANTEPVTLTVATADGMMSRIDRVVIRWNITQTGVHPQIIVRPGALAVNPAPPAIERSDTAWELGLAAIKVMAGVLAITSADIIDTRPDRAVCGFVTDGVEQLTMPEIQAKFEEFMGELGDVKNGFEESFKSINKETQLKLDNVSLQVEQFSQDISDFNRHVQYTTVDDETGAHGLRYNRAAKTFEGFNPETQKWEEITVHADLDPVSPGEPTPWRTIDGSELVKEMRAYPLDGKVAVMWEEPVSTDWAFTILVKKVGDYPINENDGERLEVITTRNARSNWEFYDDDVVNGQTYYYQAFPFNKDNQVCRDSRNRARATPNSSDRLRYGVRVWENEQNPAMERLYDAVGLNYKVTEVTAADIFTKRERNDWDFIYPFSDFQEDIVVGRVMIKIPKFYVKRSRYFENGRWFREWVICKSKYDDDYVPHEMFLKGNAVWSANVNEADYNDYIWVAKYMGSGQYSQNSVAGASVDTGSSSVSFGLKRTNIQAIGEGWRILDWFCWNGFWTLAHIVFANRNIKGILAANASVGTGQTQGALAKLVQLKNSQGQNADMSFFGIENLWANSATASRLTMLDGIGMYGNYYSTSNRYVYYQIDRGNYSNISDTESSTKIRASMELPESGKSNISSITDCLGEGETGGAPFLIIPSGFGGTSTEFWTHAYFANFDSIARAAQWIVGDGLTGFRVSTISYYNISAVRIFYTPI